MNIQCQISNIKYQIFKVFLLIPLLTFNVVLFNFYLASEARAHVLTTDHGVGAVLHISPDDDPVAGSESTLFFAFKDTSGNFSTEGCDCTAIVKREGEEIARAPLTPESDENASFTFIFPEKNVYQVTVTGNPKTEGGFEPFTLSYDVRVARSTDTQTVPGEANANQSWLSQHVPHIIGLLLVIGLFSVVLFKRNKK